MRIRNATYATALLIATMTGVAAVDLSAKAVASRHIRALLARRPGLGVATIASDPWRGRVTLGGITLRQGPMRIAVGSLTLAMPAPFVPSSWFVSPAAASPFDDKPDTPPDEHPAAQAPDKDVPDAAGAKEPVATPPSGATSPPTTPSPVPVVKSEQSQTATAENIVVTNGQTVYRIRRIDMTGTTLTSADLARLVDPNSREPMKARLETLDAAAIVVPEILVDDSTAGSERHVKIGNILLSGVRKGRVAAASVAGESFSVRTGEDNVTGSIGSFQFADLDLPQAAHVFGSTRQDESERPAHLFGSATMTALKLTNESKNVAVTLSTLTETGVKGRALRSDMIHMSKSDFGRLPDAQRAEDLQDLSHSFEIKSLEMTDFTVEGDADGKKNVLSLAKVTMRDFTPGQIGGFGLRTFAFAGPKMTFQVGTLDTGPLTLPPAKDGDPSAANTMLSAKARMDIGQIEANVLADPAEGARSSPLDVKIAHIGVVSDGEPGDLPKTSNLTFDHIAFDLPSTPGKAAPLYDMGYRHVDTSVGLIATYDSAAQSLSFHNLTLTGVGMGSVALGLDLVNVTKGITSSNQEVVKASALAILAKGLSLDVVNEGLVDKVLAWKARQDAMDVDKERAFLIDFFDDKLPASLNQSANAKILGSAVARFIAEPRTLHVGIQSKGGFGIGSLALLSDPGLLIDTLDVQASANR